MRTIFVYAGAEVRVITGQEKRFSSKLLSMENGILAISPTPLKALSYHIQNHFSLKKTNKKNPKAKKFCNINTTAIVV